MPKTAVGMRVSAPPSGGLRLRLGRPRGVADHELALDAARLALVRRAALPGAVGAELPGVRVVGERALERVEQVLLEDLVLDGHVELDARVEVARHEVGRADVDPGRAVALEGEDP